MKIAAYDRIANKQSRFVLDFCQLGFIGKTEQLSFSDELFVI